MKFLLLFLITHLCRATEFVFAPGPQEFKIELDGDVLSRRQTSITGPPGINGPIMFMAEPGTRLQTGDLMITVAAERAEKRLKQEKRRLDQSLARLKKLRQEQERDQLKKKLEERLINPRVPSAKLGGYSSVYKIKLRSAGYRLVYEVVDEELVIYVLVVGKREKGKVYRRLKDRK